MYNELQPFRFWCQKVLPLVYDDSLSYYEVLNKIVDYINNVILNQVSFSEELTLVTGDVNILKEEMLYIQSEMEKVKNGEYVSLYLDSIESWINNNLQELVGRIVKFVAFGLDDSGRLYCDVPSTWQFLDFDTDVDTNSINYGRLILEW